MTSVVVWMLGAVVMAAVSPRVLSLLMRRAVDAQIVISAWATVVCLTAVSIALPSAIQIVKSCSLVLGGSQPARMDIAIAALTAVVLLTAMVRGGWQLRQSLRSARRVHERHLGLARILHGSDPSDGEVVWLPVDRPLAYSMAGQPPLVVASTGLRMCLDAAAVAAVVTHEQAHLSRRHHVLVTGADIAAAAFPWLPLMRRSPELVRTLVELDADAHAVSVHGADGLLRALQILRHVPAPASALAITGDCTGIRLAHLARPRERCPLPSTAARTTAAIAAAILLPALSIATLIAATTLASCTIA